MPWIRTMASRRRVTRTNIREWGPLMIHRDGSRLHAKMNVEHRWCWLADGKSSLNRNCFLSSRCFLCWLNGWMIELWKVHCLIKNGEAKEAESGSRITNFSVNLDRFNYRFHFERGRFVIFLAFFFFFIIIILFRYICLLFYFFLAALIFQVQCIRCRVLSAFINISNAQRWENYAYDGNKMRKFGFILIQVPIYTLLRICFISKPNVYVRICMYYRAVRI